MNADQRIVETANQALVHRSFTGVPLPVQLGCVA
jgi:hypothetical protein